MADDRADAAQLLLVAHILVVDLAVEDARQDVDGIVLGIVEGVDHRRPHYQLIPLVLVHGGVDLIRLDGDHIRLDRGVRRQQAAAGLDPGEVQVGPVAELVRVDRSDAQVVQLLDGLFAGRVAEPVDRFQHLSIVSHDVRNDVQHVLALLLSAVGLDI